MSIFSEFRECLVFLVLLFCNVLERHKCSVSWWSSMIAILVSVLYSVAALVIFLEIFFSYQKVLSVVGICKKRSQT